MGRFRSARRVQQPYNQPQIYNNQQPYNQPQIYNNPPRVGSIRKFVNRVRSAPRVQQPYNQPQIYNNQQPYNQPQIYNNQQPRAFMQQPLQQAPPPRPGMPAPPVRTVADNSAPWNVQFQQNPHWSTTDEIEE